MNYDLSPKEIGFIRDWYNAAANEGYGVEYPDDSDTKAAEALLKKLGIQLHFWDGKA